MLHTVRDQVQKGGSGGLAGTTGTIPSGLFCVCEGRVWIGHDVCFQKLTIILRKDSVPALDLLGLLVHHRSERRFRGVQNLQGLLCLLLNEGCVQVLPDLCKCVYESITERTNWILKCITGSHDIA